MALKIEKKKNKNNELCSLVFNEDMTIYVIEMLKQQISNEIEGYKVFELDLSGVEEIDSAGIQLLLALNNELKRLNKEFKISIMSASVTKLVQVYGLSERLNIIGETL